MIDRIRKLFRIQGEERKARASEADRAHDTLVATCVLFLEMANADGEFSPDERERILRIVKRDYGLSEQEAADLLQAAAEARERSIDLWQFTSRINRSDSEEERVRIVETLWKIVYTDGTLEQHEDYLVHKLSKLLRLTHEDLIEAKMRVLHKEP